MIANTYTLAILEVHKYHFGSNTQAVHKISENFKLQTMKILFNTCKIKKSNKN